MVLLLGCISIVVTALIILTKLSGQKKAKSTIRMKTLFGIAGVITIVAIGLLGNIVWSLTHEKPPQFFPFNDPEATYTVVQRGENYLLKYESTGDMNAHQVCSREGGKTECRIEVDRDIETMIGKSDIPLEPLLGKSVQVDGNFAYSDEQCVAGKCHTIGNWAVLDVHSIEKIED